MRHGQWFHGHTPFNRQTRLETLLYRKLRMRVVKSAWKQNNPGALCTILSTSIHEFPRTWLGHVFVWLWVPLGTWHYIMSPGLMLICCYPNMDMGDWSTQFLTGPALSSTSTLPSPHTYLQHLNLTHTWSSRDPSCHTTWFRRLARKTFPGSKNLHKFLSLILPAFPH